MTYGNLKSEIDNSPVLPVSKTITNNISSLILPQVGSATLLLDLEADMLALNDNDPVSTWVDQSGNGHNFTQTSDARPTKQTVDGYPSVVFDGIDDWMEGEDFADNLTSFVVILVINGDNNSDGLLIIGKDYEDNTGGVFKSWWIASQPGLEIDDISGSFRNISKSYNSPAGNIISTLEKIDNDTYHAYLNGDNTGEHLAGGGTGAISDFSNNSTVRLGTGGGPDGISNWGFVSASISAVLIYQITDVNNWDTDRASIESWLANRYGITL